MVASLISPTRRGQQRDHGQGRSLLEQISSSDLAAEAWSVAESRAETMPAIPGIDAERGHSGSIASTPTRSELTIDGCQ